MTIKIEHIEVNGKQMPVSMFPDEVKELVLAYELARDKRNEHLTMTHALGAYLNQLTGQINTAASEWITKQFSSEDGAEALEGEDVEG